MTAPPAGSLTFSLLCSDSGSVFDAMYRVYVESLALNEQKSLEDIRSLVDRADYHVVVASASESLFGFYMLFVPPAERFCLLEYMAVGREHRNASVGTVLLQHALATAASHGERATLLEVDSDADAGPDQAIRRRRKGFYARAGCRRIVGLSYLLPLEREPPPPPMELLVHLPTAARAVQRVELRRWLEAIYEDVYGCARADPRIARMLDPIGDPVVLD